MIMLKITVVLLVLLGFDLLFSRWLGGIPDFTTNLIIASVYIFSLELESIKRKLGE